MNNIFYLRFTRGNWVYDEKRAGVVIAPDEATARQMMSIEHSDGKWLSQEIVVVEMIGYTKDEARIVLTEAHEG